MPSIFFRPQVSRFVTLFVERSGSTYLATLLDSHPDILAKREEFAHLKQRGEDGEGQLEWAKNFWTPPLFGPYKAIGFKTKIVDIMDPDGFRQLLQKSGVRVMQLQRRNLVKAVISTINARRLYEASGNWNLLNEANRLSSFNVDPNEFDRLLQERILWDRELDAYTANIGQPRLVLYYEDLLKDENGFLKQVFDFIGVQAKPVQGKTKKNTKDDLREVITNLDELRNNYIHTQFESMFDEVLV